MRALIRNLISTNAALTLNTFSSYASPEKSILNGPKLFRSILTNQLNPYVSAEANPHELRINLKHLSNRLNLTQVNSNEFNSSPFQINSIRTSPRKPIQANSISNTTLIQDTISVGLSPCIITPKLTFFFKIQIVHQKMITIFLYYTKIKNYKE